MIHLSSGNRPELHMEPARPLLRQSQSSGWILAQIKGFLEPPPIAHELERAFRGPDPDALEIVDLVESGPFLAQAIQAIARKSTCGQSRDVVELSEAVQALGPRWVLSLSWAVLIHRTLHEKHAKTQSALDATRLWRHSLATGCLAALLARQAPSLRPEDAFLAGFLHDVGIAILNAMLPKAYRRVLLRVSRNGEPLLTAEQNTLGVDHAVVGRRFGEHWRLPRTITDTLWLHHQSSAEWPVSWGSNDLILIVQEADRRVASLGFGIDGDRPSALDATSIHKRELNDSHWEIACKSIDNEMDRLGVVVFTGPEGGEHARPRPTTEHNTRSCTDSRGLDLLRAFSRHLNSDDRVEEICAAAATIMRQGWPERACAAFAWDGSKSLGYVAFYAANRLEKRAWPLSSHPSVETDARSNLVHSTLVDEALDYCRTAFIGTSVLVFPAQDGERPVGFLLIGDGSAGVGKTRQSVRYVMEPLIAYFGLMLGNALLLDQSMAAKEALLAKSRRTQESREQDRRTLPTRTVGRIAAGAAHELNNPLTIISGRAQLLLASDPLDSRQRRALEVIQEESGRCSRIIAEFMSFAKPPPPRPTPIPLSSLIGTLCAIRADATRIPRPNLVVDLADDRAAVFVDPEQVKTALSELLNNAMEASSPHGAPVTINSSARRSDEIVVITVEDRGRGMTHETLEGAFDPFFSSRPAGRGRGLGLSKAKSYIENNGGRLSLESTPGIGTKVTVWLPARPPE